MQASHLVVLANSKSMHIQVVFKGTSYQLELPQEAQLSDLADHLAQRCSVATSTIKLLAPKAGGVIKPDERPQITLIEAGIREGMKLKMMASSTGEVAAVQQGRDLPGLAPLDHELRREVARAGGGVGGGQPPMPRAHPSPANPYTFEQYRVWQRPGLQPPPSEALKLLHRLAGDPGIQGVMVRHRWRVGVLSEMPPEGRVGVSPVCLLGVNINQGQEISLRLRTDDLKGFRRYDRIVETLLHELAHMVHSQHDTGFKELNSQLRREAAALDWRRGGAAQPGGALAAFQGVLQYDLPPAGSQGAMASTAQLSGSTLRQLAGGGSGEGLGAGAAANAEVAPTAAAAQAAMLRAQGGGAAAGEAGTAGSLYVAPPNPPTVQQPGTGGGEAEGQHVYRKGDGVLYRQRDGSWIDAQVVSVDLSVRPLSYGISLEGGGDGSYRETEGLRLRPRQGGEVQGLGHTDGSTEAKEEEVRRKLEE